jgi:hypothetical protein
MYTALNCHNVAKHTEFYLVERDLQWYSKCYCQAGVTKTFTLKRHTNYPAFKNERWIACTPLSVNVFVTLTTQ